MAKSVTLKNLLNILVNQRAQNKTIVFTHGCFESLHSGHVQLLKCSKLLGDILIVGLESNSRVAFFKGHQNKMQSYSKREKELASVGYVDYILRISGDPASNPMRHILNIYSYIQPNYITYGRGFSMEGKIPELRESFTNIAFQHVNTLYQYSVESKRLHQ